MISKESFGLLYFPSVTGQYKITLIEINYKPFNTDVYTSAEVNQHFTWLRGYSILLYCKVIMLVLVIRNGFIIYIGFQMSLKSSLVKFHLPLYILHFWLCKLKTSLLVNPLNLLGECNVLANEKKFFKAQVTHLFGNWSVSGYIKLTAQILTSPQIAHLFKHIIQKNWIWDPIITNPNK